MKESLNIQRMAMRFVLTLVLLVSGATDVTSQEFRVDDFMYKKTNTGEVMVLDYYGSDNAVSIPGSISYAGESFKVTGIGATAFTNKTQMTSIDIPDCVTVIEDDGSYVKGAFSGCTGLTSIDLPDGLRYIPRGTFKYCSALKTIDFPERLDSIGMDAFAECVSLTSITFPENLKGIGGFSGCKNLTNFDIPDNVKYIGEWAFSFCAKK